MDVHRDDRNLWVFTGLSDSVGRPFLLLRCLGVKEMKWTKGIWFRKAMDGAVLLAFNVKF